MSFNVAVIVCWLLDFKLVKIKSMRLKSSGVGLSSISANLVSRSKDFRRLAAPGDLGLGGCAGSCDGRSGKARR
jgi:hypothetical protein